LTQRPAATILGEEPTVFGRYERGEMIPKRAICQLLRLLNNHPEQLQELIGSEVQ
jgi:DNA-binding transcriptional regulator YiaG